MIPLSVVVLDELTHCALEVALADRNQPIQTLLGDGPHEPSRVRMQAGDAVPLDAVQYPHVADVLEQRLAFLWSGWWPGVGHARDGSAESDMNREGVARRGTSKRIQRGICAAGTVARWK
jgi:hypothetical protein